MCACITTSHVCISFISGVKRLHCKTANVNDLRARNTVKDQKKMISISVLDGRGGCPDTMPRIGSQSIHPVVDHLTLDLHAET